MFWATSEEYLEVLGHPTLINVVKPNTTRSNKKIKVGVARLGEKMKNPKLNSMNAQRKEAMF